MESREYNQTNDSMKENKKITILLPTSGSLDKLERTLDSLSECELPSAYRETIVIENGPPAGAETIIQRYAARFPIRHIHFFPKGKSRALNYALQDIIQEPDFILFTDDDVRFNAKWIAKYQEAIKKYGPGHYFGGAFGVDYEEDPSSDILPHLPISATGLSDDYYANTEVVWFLGFNWGAFREDLCRVGLFNPHLGPGSSKKALGQESEMQKRMFNQGLKPIYVPQNQVWHYVPKHHLTQRWIFQRRISSGVLSSYLLRKKPFKLIHRLLVGIYDVFGLTLYLFSKQRFYWHYYRLGYRFGLIKGILSRAKRRINSDNRI